MKVFLSITTLFAFFITVRPATAQTQVNADTLKRLNQRIDSIELAVKQQRQEQQKAIEEGPNKERYEAATTALRTGLQNGIEIEHIVPESIRYLAFTDLVQVVEEINNPTESALGTPFTDMVTESAVNHLLPNITDQARKAATVSKFKKILTSIYNGPILQTLIKSNPISSTINAAVQQAGFFEQPRTVGLLITKEELKGKVGLDKNLEAANLNGPPFGSTEMDAFNNELSERVAFYNTIREFSQERRIVIDELKQEAQVIKLASKAAASEICKNLKIPTTDMLNEFHNQYDRVTENSTMKTYLKNENFQKAVKLSDYGADQILLVKEFKTRVLEEAGKIIDGYIRILSDYRDKPQAKLKVASVNSVIVRLTNIKKELN